MRACKIVNLTAKAPLRAGLCGSAKLCTLWNSRDRLSAADLMLRRGSCFAKVPLPPFFASVSVSKGRVPLKEEWLSGRLEIPPGGHPTIPRRLNGARARMKRTSWPRGTLTVRDREQRTSCSPSQRTRLMCVPRENVDLSSRRGLCCGQVVPSVQGIWRAVARTKTSEPPPTALAKRGESQVRDLLGSRRAAAGRGGGGGGGGGGGCRSARRSPPASRPRSSPRRARRGFSRRSQTASLFSRN